MLQGIDVSEAGLVYFSRHEEEGWLKHGERRICGSSLHSTALMSNLPLKYSSLASHILFTNHSTVFQRHGVEERGQVCSSREKGCQERQRKERKESLRQGHEYLGSLGGATITLIIMKMRMLLSIP